MSNKALQVNPSRKWIVDNSGKVTESKKMLMTSGQRHQAYRLALQAAELFMLRHGFLKSDNSTGSSYIFMKNRVSVELLLKEAANIAYVTSHIGYEYKKEVIGKATDGQERYRVNATVHNAGMEMKCTHVIQILVNTDDAYGTRIPAFIPLSPDLDDPARFTLHGIIKTLAVAADSIPRLKETFNAKTEKQSYYTVDQVLSQIEDML